MSLINEALKRARQAETQRAKDNRAPLRLEPVEHPARSGAALRALLTALVVLLSVLAVLLLSRWWRATEATPTLTQHPPTNRVPVEPLEEPAVEPAPVSSISGIRVSTNLVVRTNPVTRLPLVHAPLVSRPAPDNAGAAGPPASPRSEFPRLKLQSIIYRMNKPAAVINGEMLHVGEAVQGARVLNIDRQTVTLEWNGVTNVLALPRL
jgi:hypothetical protein